MRALTSIAGFRWRLVFVVLAMFSAGCVKEEPKAGPATPFPEVTVSPRPGTPSPRPPAPKAPPPERPNAFQRPTLPPPHNSNNQEGAIRLSPNPAPTSSPGPSRQLTNELGLFAYFPQQRLMPDDFRIGPLQDGVSGARDNLRARETIRAFFDGIAQKKVDDTLVLPADLAEIKAVVSYPLAQGYVPQRWRVGKLAFENDGALRATIRLFKDEGATTGEIYLAKDGDQWRVSDLQAGFTLLGKKYEKPKEPFMPGSYQFLRDNR
jgi:hypothetical protein